MKKLMCLASLVLAMATVTSCDPNVPYSGTNGAVWGFKCPTLTRHIWNKLYFSQAYPHYEEWITSGGTQYPDWYVRDIDERFVVCWW